MNRISEKNQKLYIKNPGSLDGKRKKSVKYPKKQSIVEKEG